MPCKNAAATIAASIASVQAQTLHSWELVAADDGSDDNTRDIVAQFAKNDPRIKLLNYTGGRNGASAARNRALDQASGRYIAFLDSDDLWLPEKLETQIGEMQAQLSAFSCSAYRVRRNGKADIVRRPPSAITRRILLRGNRIGCLTAIYDSAVLGKQPMPDIPLRHDYALWLHLLTLTETALGLQQVLAIHHRRTGSLSSNVGRASLATWSMLRTEAGLNSLQAAHTLLRHLLGRILRG
jgi:glycosyltransferase involved in cell wall biosynthesis